MHSLWSSLVGRIGATAMVPQSPCHSRKPHVSLSRVSSREPSFAVAVQDERGRLSRAALNRIMLDASGASHATVSEAVQALLRQAT